MSEFSFSLSMIPLSDSSRQLFAESVPVLLCQPGTSGSEQISSNIDINLSIFERCHGNNDKEFRIEISRPDEFEFLFAEGITRGKFQNLAKTWGLNVNFEDFPKRIIRLLKERGAPSFPVQLNCTLCQDYTICIFEIVRQFDMQTVRMPIELRAVQGQDLKCHLMNNLRQYKKQVEELLSSTREIEKLRNANRLLEDEYSNYKQRIEEEKAEWERKLHEARERADEEASKREDLENDLELERDEHQAAHSMIDRLEDDIHILQEDLDCSEEEAEALKAQLENSKQLIYQLRNDKDDLLEKVEILKQKLKKGNYVLGTYIKEMKENTRSPVPNSCDEKKLTELETDLKEKNLLVEKMTGIIAESKKKYDSLLAENTRLKATVEDLENREQRRNRVLGMYGSSLSPGSFYPNLAATAGFPRVISSPLGSSVSPMTPTYPPRLGQSLQTFTARATPSTRNTSPGLSGKILATSVPRVLPAQNKES